jgi:hypothetical protein
MKTKFALLIVAISLCSCASTRLRPEAESVTVSDLAPPANCKEVGSVETVTHVNVSHTSKNLLINQLKNNAYDLGGNYVLLEVAAPLKHSGKVYRCP